MQNRYFRSFFIIIKFWFAPILMYFIIFCVLTYPLIFFFNTHFFADTGDGLQNVWNIWWVNKAVTQLNQSPWYTTYLHYPDGTSLLGQTLNPFNGFMGIFLLKFLSLIQTHNVIVVFSFVIGGLTTFWLAYHLTKSYWSSLIAGYIFTFSQFHFAHAEGHLQLVSLEWIPLFILCWFRLLASPGYIRAVISATVLLAVLLCDYYYFLFCVLAAIVMVIWHALSTGNYLFIIRKKNILIFALFLTVCISTSGILIFQLMRINSQDPLLGSHNPLVFSLDLLAPFIPGGHWQFASLTQFYWSRLPGNIHESSVYMGLSVIFLIVYTWVKRKRCRQQVPSLSLWFVILFFFGILALGPDLHVAGKSIYTGIMPYDILQVLFPPLKLSGCPVRMMVMVMLSASIIGAAALSMLFKQINSKGMLSMVYVLMVLLLLETLPKPLPASKVPIPEYINILKSLSGNGAVIDTVTPAPVPLYYQTIHEKPMGDGYISRIPTSVYAKYLDKVQAVQNREYSRLLRDYDIRYLIISSSASDSASNILKTLYDNNGTGLYQITEEP